VYTTVYTVGRASLWYAPEFNDTLCNAQEQRAPGIAGILAAERRGKLEWPQRLTWALRRARIATRLTQIAYEHEQSSEPNEPLPLLRAYKPRAAAIEAIPDLTSLLRAKSIEDLEIALDKAQSVLLQALESSDPRMRIIAARLMLKTRQARERGWS
jgi:hypothetical protein